MRAFITRIIDFFHPPFRRFMPLQTFRYAACGGGNALLGIIIYFVFHEYIFAGRVFDLGFYMLKPHTAALLISSFTNLIVGFALNRYIVFTSSYLRGRIQLFRYFLSFSFNLLFNLGMLKLLVEVLHWNFLLSQVLSIMLVIALSYFTQRHFTFRIKKDGHGGLSELK